MPHRSCNAPKPLQVDDEKEGTGGQRPFTPVFSKGKEGNALDTDVDGALTSGPRGERKGEGKSAVVLGAVPSSGKR
jgi:hypothetical protein